MGVAFGKETLPDEHQVAGFFASEFGDRCGLEDLVFSSLVSLIRKLWEHPKGPSRHLCACYCMLVVDRNLALL